MKMWYNMSKPNNARQIPAPTEYYELFGKDEINISWRMRHVTINQKAVVTEEGIPVSIVEFATLGHLSYKASILSQSIIDQQHELLHGPR